MKLVLVSLVTAIALSGCIVVSTKPDSTKPYQSNVIDFKPTDQISRVETKGQVICEASKPCPEITFEWKLQPNNLYKVRADFYDNEKFDIQRIVFRLDGQPHEFNVTGATTQRPVLNSQMVNSSNYIDVPASFLNNFNSAKAIDISIVTEKGDISHSILKEDKVSFAYKTFNSGYRQTSNP
ncbi:hypothetical protein AMD27_08660 [Acinetobacter sp. TGL-Y2]|uniref:hypothetical protein n=1 Tax=Acinetobacter sp. TGL-Y2 TaxID=1407071 RepID=UPI0007A67860|nr:hypothetical protein [Acinetobacter sp. TGL-Y2]AMW78941.1 hypothetical protein AMD27_08660 [Acinetobacter sp. TGL-Y2]